MWVADEILQKKFKQMVEPMFQQVEILNQQNTQLRQIRDRLLPRLISGKLEVKSPIPTK
jgi:type I restriction enzyme S subunit